MTEDEVRALLDVLAWDSEFPNMGTGWAWGEDPQALASQASLVGIRCYYGCPVLPWAGA